MAVDVDGGVAAAVPRTQDRMWHDLFLPADVEHVRELARGAVAKHLAPVARDIGQARGDA